MTEDRLRHLADGRVRLDMRRAWRDGAAHLLFEPVEYLEKLAALTPQPEINLALYPHCDTAGSKGTSRGEARND